METVAIADLYGRRRSMIVSMSAYVTSFGVFGYSLSVWQLFLIITLFAAGEAFRTGTHQGNRILRFSTLSRIRKLASNPLLGAARTDWLSINRLHGGQICENAIALRNAQGHDQSTVNRLSCSAILIPCVKWPASACLGVECNVAAVFLLCSVLPTDSG